jgi:hypothetical protein
MGKPKIQIPKPKQIPRSQIPKPGDWLPRWNLEFGVYLGFGFWVLEFRGRNGKLLMRQPCVSGGEMF